MSLLLFPSPLALILNLRLIFQIMASISADAAEYSATAPHRWEGEEVEPLTRHTVLHAYGRDRQPPQSRVVEMSWLGGNIKISLPSLER